MLLLFPHHCCFCVVIVSLLPSSLLLPPPLWSRRCHVSRPAATFCSDDKQVFDLFFFVDCCVAAQLLLLWLPTATLANILWLVAASPLVTPTSPIHQRLRLLLRRHLSLHSYRASCPACCCVASCLLSRQHLPSIGAPASCCAVASHCAALVPVRGHPHNGIAPVIFVVVAVFVVVIFVIVVFPPFVFVPPIFLSLSSLSPPLPSSSPESFPFLPSSMMSQTS
jgi:hypothetical protein